MKKTNMKYELFVHDYMNMISICLVLCYDMRLHLKTPRHKVQFCFGSGLAMGDSSGL